MITQVDSTPAAASTLGNPGAGGAQRHRDTSNKAGKRHRSQFQHHPKGPDPHQQAKTDEDQVFAKLRFTYGQKLQTLKEVFTSEWSDNDLLTILDEVQGDVDTAIDRISQGNEERHCFTSLATGSDGPRLMWQTQPYARAWRKMG